MQKYEGEETKKNKIKKTIAWVDHDNNLSL